MSAKRRAVRNVRRGMTAVDDAQRVMHDRAHAGYCDASEHRSYPAEYDLWETNQQLAYETGRLWASSLVGTPLAVPWSNAGPPPAAVREAVNRAAALSGSPFPERYVMPPDDKGAAPQAPLEAEPQPRRKKWRRRRM